MTDLISSTSPTSRKTKRGDESNNAVIGVQRYQGLSLEPLNKNVVEIQSDDNNVEAINKEEEIIKKRKTELTTTKQIETRIKRNVVFEDGKVIEDSGPIVSTNTTEDTDKQETVQTEHRTLGDPNEVEALELNKVNHDNNNNNNNINNNTNKINTASNNNNKTNITDNKLRNYVNNEAPKMINAIVTRADGLVRDIKEEVVVSREETNELTETEDVKHFGDFSDDAYMVAVKSGADDIREILLSPEIQNQKVVSGPRILQQTTRTRKTVDSEDTDIKCSAQLDGTLVTEKIQTRQHEEFIDQPGDVDEIDGHEKVNHHNESSQKYFKQRDEQNVEYVANGQVIGKEMKYVAETIQMDQDGINKEGLLSEWDSLSDRLRKARRLGKHSTPKEQIPATTTAAITDRTDALTKRPLDFDREEETRKLETNKWLESHFGSESRSSKDSRDDLDEIVEPTKKTYFNVTIKSNQAPSPPHLLSSPSKVNVPEREERIKTKYFQGVSDWTERKRESTSKYSNHRRSQDNLDEPEKDNNYKTIPRNRTKYDQSLIRESSLNHVSGDDAKNSIQRDDSAYISSSTFFTSPRSPNNVVYGHEGRSVSPELNKPKDTRPTVPQRKKVLERKLKLSAGTLPSPQKREEPPPDYLPRSRSVSPIQIPLATNTLKKPYQKTRFSSTQDISSTRSLRAQSMPPKTKVGSAIGNSIRKLVGKIRSASAERKLKLRSSSKQRSPSPTSSYNKRNSTTYQQYNVIDGHIGQQQHIRTKQGDYNNRNNNNNIQTSNSNKTNGNVTTSSRRDLTFDRRGSSDIISDMTSNSGPTPKQKYYLGENPYSGSIYGKENKYDGQSSALLKSSNRRYMDEQKLAAASSNSRSASQPPQSTTNTLGRFSKSTNRLIANSPSSTKSTNDHQQYASNDTSRSSQTLPRKLNQHKLGVKPLHSSTINVSIVNTVKHPMNSMHSGPAKPARTYKALNRSKSFNVHGLNGSADPSPIYIEKLSKNNYNSFYKSNPHLNDLQSPTRHQNTPLSAQLKSPSIVNLISRSQRDLTQSPLYEDEGKIYSRTLNNNNYLNNEHHTKVADKRNVFLRNLQNQAPELYRTLHGNGNTSPAAVTTPSRDYLTTYLNREQESSLGSRSPITINKDTASIIRRGSSSTDDYSETYKIIQKSEDPHRPGVTNTVKNFSKKTVPTKDGRCMQTIETSEIKTTSSSRYKGEPMSNLKYQEFKNGGITNGNGGVVIEVRGNS